MPRLGQRTVVSMPKRLPENDLRAKAASDSATLEDAGQLLGHTDAAVTKRHYGRGVVKVEPLR